MHMITSVVLFYVPLFRRSGWRQWRCRRHNVALQEAACTNRVPASCPKNDRTVDDRTSLSHTRDVATVAHTLAATEHVRRLRPPDGGPILFISVSSSRSSSSLSLTCCAQLFHTKTTYTHIHFTIKQCVLITVSGCWRFVYCEFKLFILAFVTTCNE